jgi:hypothetical protein
MNLKDEILKLTNTAPIVRDEQDLSDDGKLVINLSLNIVLILMFKILLQKYVQMMLTMILAKMITGAENIDHLSI